MKILIVGSGGREHAIAHTIAKTQRSITLFGIGNNAAMEQFCEMKPLSLTDHQAIISYALDQKIDFAVVGSDGPLVAGLCDVFTDQGIPCFGPSKAAARLEGSKAFAKEFMARHHIPTPSYNVFHSFKEAKAFVDTLSSTPIVVKADGLALGKGVVIAQSKEEAHQALDEMMNQKCFGESGTTVVIEEFVQGVEVSLLLFSDGTTAKAMVSAMDHKRAGDGDCGPNTGGMGVITPNPYFTEEMAHYVEEHITKPTLQGMKQEGNPFIGCLFLGLMLTEQGPTVIEYNCRFGDPEAQAVLPLLESDLLEIMIACTQGRLKEIDVLFNTDYACSVALTSGGYPGIFEKGKVITISSLPSDIEVFHAATALNEHKNLITTGGRVLHVVGKGSTIEKAITKTYQAIEYIHFEKMAYRKDIGQLALYKEKEDGASLLR
ncbi:MAG: phosphoribosylamine--glycine ligase [Sphaerochaetaceae bacterium]